jgi:hypothetical protein
MRLVLALIPVFLLACGGGGGGTDDQPYDTFQDCFDDHHKVETFDVQTSIKICCIDHPIGGVDKNMVCGETAADCVTYLGANLATADASPDDRTMACDGYIMDRNQ